MADMTVAEAYAARDDVVLLDVREHMEWVAGHIDGAVHVPMHELAPKQDVLETGKPIVCVCRSGARSASVARALVEAGYDARNMLGGMHAWSAAELPFISSGDQPPFVA